MNHISIDKLLEKRNHEKIYIIDIRQPIEYSGGYIPGSKNIPAQRLLLDPAYYLDKNKTYYLYCHSGHTSNNVSNRLNGLGYNTVNIDGGYNNYLLMK